MSIFSRSTSKSVQDKVDRAYDKKVGRDYSGVWSGSKSGSLSTVKDDFLMDIGAKEKTSSYYARLDDRARRSRESGPSNDDDGGGGRSAPRKTARQEYEEMRAAALAKMRIEGQERRKKFEKEKGERVAALKKKRAKLLNI